MIIICIFFDEINNPNIAKIVFGSTFKHENRIIFSDDNILAIPGYGPQVYPYILVMTRRHISSFLGISKEERTSFFNFFSLLLDSGLYSSSSLCIFEHGGEPKNGCSSVTHCHIHVIDGDLGFFDFIDWGKEQENVILTPETISIPYDDYLFIGEYRGDEINAKINTTPMNEHQYFRKQLVNVLNADEWDWKTGMNNDTFVPRLINEAILKLKRD